MHIPDDRNDADEPISGRLEGISVPDLMWSLCRSEATGVLRLTHDDVRKTVYFEGGRIVFAASSDANDRLGEQMLRAGVLDLAQLQQGTDRMGSGKRLGTILVESGAITAGQLVQGVLDQVEHIILDLFEWDRGEYVFEEGPLPTHEVITLGMKTGELLMRGVRRVTSFVRLRRSVGSPGCTYRLSDEAEDVLDGIKLTEVEEDVRRQLLDGPKTVDDLCRTLYHSNFDVCLALWGFRILGAVRVDERGLASAGASTIEGRFGEEGIAPVVVPLSRIGETGVLYVTNGSVERSLHLREGRCVFATSSNVDDGLITFLLRRGVISLRDREETAKRLLSNKRVGTILREMGVLDGQDLQSMVQEHLREIVYDTLAWSRGEFAFVPGELPTIEEITLDASVENLVIEAIRRVPGFDRIRQGFGGTNTGMRLTPGFLDILDRMRIGPEEWAVVTALKSASTAQQVCGEVDLEDFRVCQILWAFRILGVVEHEPVEESEAVDVAAATAAVVAGDSDGTPFGEAAIEPDRNESEAAAAEFFAECDPEPIPADPVGAAEPQTVAEDYASGPEPASETGATPEDASYVPEMESPGDATLYVPREQVEAALAGPTGERQTDSADDPDPISPFLDATELESPGVGDDESSGSDSAPAGEPELASGPSEPVGEEVGDRNEELDDTARIERGEVDRMIAAVESSATLPGPLSGTGETEDGIEAHPPEPIGDDPEHDTQADASPADGPDFDADTWSLPELRDPGVAAEEPDGFEVEEPSELPELPEEGVDAVGAPYATGGAEDEEGAVEPVPQMESAVTPEAEVPGWDPPSTLDRDIARLNAQQRVLFRTIRAEVGAGAVNFVRSCCGRFEEGGGSPFPEASLLRDGSWDERKLREAAIECRLADPWGRYRDLLDLELEMLRMHVGEARAAAVQQQLERADAEAQGATGG